MLQQPHLNTVSPKRPCMGREAAQDCRKKQSSTMSDRSSNPENRLRETVVYLVTNQVLIYEAAALLISGCVISA